MEPDEESNYEDCDEDANADDADDVDDAYDDVHVPVPSNNIPVI
jgi:hypothetical protein